MVFVCLFFVFSMTASRIKPTSVNIFGGFVTRFLIINKIPENSVSSKGEMNTNLEKGFFCLFVVFFCNHIGLVYTSLPRVFVSLFVCFASFCFLLSDSCVESFIDLWKLMFLPVIFYSNVY